MNTTVKHILERRSIRNYVNEPLTKEQINTLIEVALASPTPVNRQTSIFRLITRQNLIEQMSANALDTFAAEGDFATIERMKTRHKSIFYGAPLVIVIGLPEADESEIEAGIAVQNLAVAAQSMGLGSCIIGMVKASFKGEAGRTIKESIDWPEGYKAAISIAIGKPAMTKEKPEQKPGRVKHIV